MDPQPSNQQGAGPTERILPVPFKYNIVNTNVSPETFGRVERVNFRSLTASNEFLYVFFDTEATWLRLARLHKATNYWEPIDLPHARLPFRNLNTLVWSPGTLVLSAGEHLVKIDLNTRSVRPIRSPIRHRCEYLCQVADQLNRCLYVLCKSYSNVIEYSIIVYVEGDEANCFKFCAGDARLCGAKYMASWDKWLYILTERPEGSDGEPFGYCYVVCVNKSNCQLTMHPTEPFIEPSGHCSYPQSNGADIKWAQSGDSLYGVGAMERCGSSAQYYFWQLHLPSLSWVKHPVMEDEHPDLYLLCASNNDIWAFPRTQHITFSD